MHKKLIMIIEDSDSIRHSLVDIMEDEGYDVVAVSQGQEGLELLNKDCRPDLILLDLMMPVMDGYEFREHKKNNKVLESIPTLIMSAKNNLEQTLALAKNELILPKPFGIDQLFELMIRCLNQKSLSPMTTC